MRNGPVLQPPNVGGQSPARVINGKPVTRPVTRAGLFRHERLLGDDVTCLGPLGAVFHGEADSLTFGQGFETRALDRAEVHEHVCAAIVLGNKTKALGFVKPLYSTCSHEYVTFKNSVDR